MKPSSPGRRIDWFGGIWPDPDIGNRRGRSWTGTLRQSARRISSQEAKGSEQGDLEEHGGCHQATHE
jgi:hypothetical protein